MLYQLNYWRVRGWRLTGLLVNRMPTAPGAILLDLHTIRHGCLVLGRRIVTTLALGAGKGDESTHESNYLQIPPRTGTMEYDSICALILSTVYSLGSVNADAFHNCYPPFWEANSCVRRRAEVRFAKRWNVKTRLLAMRSRVPRSHDPNTSATRSYSMMVETTPEPTVWPPSRIAKRRPSSMAIGWMRSPSMVMWSPGMAISVPSGSLTVPVTSVVRK